ncbi:MAG: hypothetical protein PHV74_10060 [Dehalococcoidia bacterium]|nr:hypothetical protein [Dehalococcoidia bacterium]
MARVITRLFHRPDDLNQAIIDLKALGYKATVIDGSTDIEKVLADACLSPQALDYYKIGTAAGGKLVAVNVDDAKVDEVNKLLLAIGFDPPSAKPDQRSASPGFFRARRMSATNPIDAQMTGDFRKY